MNTLETDVEVSADGSLKLLSPLPEWLKPGRMRLVITEVSKTKVIRPERRARLFLSCGQREDELKWGEAVRDALDYNKTGGLGFEVFFARSNQDSKAILERVFDELHEADYFVFLDFKREQFTDPPGGFRGSLYCHQELALACFLKTEIAVFREDDVEAPEGAIELNGIMKEVMSNAVSFTRNAPDKLAALVCEKVKSKGWSLETRHRLGLSLAEDNRFRKGDVDPPNNQNLGKGKVFYFHLAVENLHHRIAATNCYAYLASVVEEDTNTTRKLQTCELKWVGTKLQGVRIGARQHRKIDGFIVHKASGSNQINLAFWPETDATHDPSFKQSWDRDIKLRVRYVVTCDEYRDSSEEFEVHFTPDSPSEATVEVWHANSVSPDEKFVISFDGDLPTVKLHEVVQW